MSITIGVQRESLLNNPLLQKTELGKPVKRCFTLPPEDFTYGRPNLVVDDGAAGALCQWNVVKPKVVTKTKEERDFVKLNKAAVQAGLTSAPEHTHFRSTHDHIVRETDSAKDRKLNKLKKIPPSMVYGVPTRPSTPVFDLLQHRYGEKWLQERQKAEEALRAKQEKKKRVNREIYDTRACLLSKYQPPVESNELWHMKKFDKIQASTETFRTEEDKRNAFKHHNSDSTARKGVFGHGVYETGKAWK